MENASANLKSIAACFRLKLRNLYPETEIMQFFYFLAEEFFSWNRAAVQLHYEEMVDTSVARLFDEALLRLSNGEPIQYILGKSHFGGMIFKVSLDVLIPRPETEELCNLIRTENSGKKYQEFSILDIGTGSGCIPVFLKRAFPYARVTAIDKMETALRMAGENAMNNNTEIRFLKADILDIQSWKALGQFDIIVSNPPYVLESERALMHRNVLEYEPYEALFVPDQDPLIFYRHIADFSWKSLLRPGCIYFEINEKYGVEVKSLLTAKGFERVEIVKDFSGRERFVKAECRSAIVDTSYWYADKT